MYFLLINISECDGEIFEKELRKEEKKNVFIFKQYLEHTMLQPRYKIGDEIYTLTAL